MTAQAVAGGSPLFRIVRWLAPAAQPAIALVIAALVGGLLVAAIGDDPIQVYGILISGSLVGVPNLMVTLQIMTPLLFTGLAVSISFRAGLWNIGVEGQMLVGALLRGARRLVVAVARGGPYPAHADRSHVRRGAVERRFRLSCVSSSTSMSLSSVLCSTRSRCC